MSTATSTTTLNVTPEVGAILPDNVIGFIWRLALADACSEAELQTFIVVPNTEKEDTLNIAHSYHRPNLRKWRQMPHAHAAECCLSVQRDEAGYTMTLLEQSPKALLSGQNGAPAARPLPEIYA